MRRCIFRAPQPALVLIERRSKRRQLLTRLRHPSRLSRPRDTLRRTQSNQARIHHLTMDMHRFPPQRHPTRCTHPANPHPLSLETCNLPLLHFVLPRDLCALRVRLSSTPSSPEMQLAYILARNAYPYSFDVIPSLPQHIQSVKTPFQENGSTNLPRQRLSLPVLRLVTRLRFFRALCAPPRSPRPSFPWLTNPQYPRPNPAPPKLFLTLLLSKIACQAPKPCQKPITQTQSTR